MDVATHEQEGSTDEFNEKENDQYAAIPKDRTLQHNSTYVGTASAISRRLIHFCLVIVL